MLGRFVGDFEVRTRQPVALAAPCFDVLSLTVLAWAPARDGSGFDHHHHHDYDDDATAAVLVALVVPRLEQPCVGGP